MLCRISLVVLVVVGWTSIGLSQGRDTSVGIGSSQTSGGTVLGNFTNRNSAPISPAEAAGLGNRQTALGALGGTGGFLGQTGNVDRGFLRGGADNGGQNANPTANRGGGQFGNFGNFGNFGGQGGRGGRLGQPQQTRQSRIIRTRISIPRDLAIPVVAAPYIQTKLVNQFDRLGSMEAVARVKEGSSRAFWNSSITVVTTGQTVTLRGRVSSERDRKIAEKMAKFEPGVVQVVNELSVVPSS